MSPGQTADGMAAGGRGKLTAAAESRPPAGSAEA